LRCPTEAFYSILHNAGRFHVKRETFTASCKHKHNKQLALAKTKRRQTTTEIGETELRCTER